MANEKNIKKVEELKQKFDDSHGVILAEYRGLTVPEIADLREKIYQNSTFEVTKNTLLKIAAKDKGFSDDFISVLQGPTAVAFVKDDPYATLKELDKFGEKNDSLVLKFGYFDGKDASFEDLTELAKLPTKTELYAKVAGLLQASAQKVAALASAFGQNVHTAVSGYAEKLEKEGPVQTQESTTQESPTVSNEEKQSSSNENDVVAKDGDQGANNDSQNNSESAEKPVDNDKDSAEKPADTEPSSSVKEESVEPNGEAKKEGE